MHSTLDMLGGYYIDFLISHWAKPLQNRLRDYLDGFQMFTGQITWFYRWMGEVDNYQ
jgi:hypothetical protein